MQDLLQTQAKIRVNWFCVLFLSVPFCIGYTTPLHAYQLEAPSQIADAMYEVPHLVQLVFPKSAAALANCSRQLRRLVHNFAQRITLETFNDIGQLAQGDWPQLCAVIVRQTRADPGFKWPSDCDLELVAALELSRRTRYGISKAFVVRSLQWQPQLQIEHVIKAMMFLHSPKWRKLTVLRIDNIVMESHSVSLLNSFAWPRLREIGISITDLDAVCHLAQAAWPSLLVLQLRVTNVTPAGIERLTTVRWSFLQSLILTTPPLSESVIFTPNKTSWPSLVRVHLSNIKLDVVSFGQLAVAYHTQLQELTLKCVGLTAAALSDLMQVPWLLLCMLDLSGNDLGAAELAAMVPAALPRLEKLMLVGTKLDVAAVKVLVKCNLPSLDGLGLSGNCLDDTAMRHLAQADWPQLENVFLNINQISAMGTAFLVNANWPAVRQLWLDKMAVAVQTADLLSSYDLPEGSRESVGWCSLHGRSLSPSGFESW